MASRDITDVDHSLGGVKVKVAQLEERFDNHLENAKDVISAAFAAHELREAEQQKQLLVKTIKLLFSWFLALVTAIGGAAWFLFTSWADKHPW